MSYALSIVGALNHFQLKLFWIATKIGWKTNNASFSLKTIAIDTLYRYSVYYRLEIIFFPVMFQRKEGGSVHRPPSGRLLKN